MPGERTTRIQELIYELKVSDVMTTNVISLQPTTPMGEMRDVLRRHRISGLPVVEGERLAGVASIEDFIRWLVDGKPDCLVADRMTRDVKTVFEDELLIHAVNKLEQYGFGRFPVCSRTTGDLVGVITKGDVIEGLLKKLDVDYREAEKRGARSQHVFEDIVADRSFLVFEYDIDGSDFARAGSCASGLKTTLLRLGFPPEFVRRAAIATYEAEMNIIVHAGGGGLSARVTPSRIRVEAVDDGPGIEDIGRAMQAGYSTAPDWVRELGFGAGMGLNNIQQCSDGMRLESEMGEGTRLEFEIGLERGKCD